MGISLSLSAVYEEPLGLPERHAGTIYFNDRVSQMSFGHRHVELELNLVVGGRAAYLLGDRRYELRRNTVVWLFPGQDHVLLDKSANYAMYLGLFKPTLIGQVCKAPRSRILRDADPPGSFCRHLSEDAARSLESLLQSVAAARDDDDLFNAGLGWALLSAWSSYMNADEREVGVELHPAVDRAVRLIRSGSAPDGIDDLAGECGLSASRLSRLFREQMGLPLVDFRNRQRLQAFIRLFGRGRARNIMEAALEAGFGSYPQFHRVFTRHMGCSPSAFHRRNRG